MRTIEVGRLTLAFILASQASLGTAQEPPAKPVPDHWKQAATGYHIVLESTGPASLTLRETPVLTWTNPQRKTDDGSVYLWTDRGRPEVAASFYRYKNKTGLAIEDHEFVSLAELPLSTRHAGEVTWSPVAGNVHPVPIPDAPRPAGNPAERLRQMKALAREFKATYNNPPDLSEIRLLPQPLYRFETEGKRTDILDGALFAYVQTTDPEVLLLIEARASTGGGPMVWHYSFARMSMVNMRVQHRDREVWSVRWATDLENPINSYFVRSYPAAP